MAAAWLNWPPAGCIRVLPGGKATTARWRDCRLSFCVRGGQTWSGLYQGQSDRRAGARYLLRGARAVALRVCPRLWQDVTHSATLGVYVGITAGCRSCTDLTG